MTIPHLEFNRIEQVKDYVCTLEQARKLNDLGIKKKSLFYWGNRIGGRFKGDRLVIEAYDNHETGISRLHPFIDKVECYSAFTSQELGELILKYQPNAKISLQFGINGMRQDISNTNISCIGIEGKYTVSPYNNEAQARAEFLICHLEKQDQRTIDFKNKIEQSKNGVTND